MHAKEPSLVILLYLKVDWMIVNEKDFKKDIFLMLYIYWRLRLRC